MSAQTVRPSSRAAIVAAAVAVLNANVGASMSEIAIRAGVGRATLHRHFSSKDELVAAIAVDCMDELENAIGERLVKGMPALDRLRVMLEATIPLGDRFAFLSSQMAGTDASYARYRAELDWVERLVDRLKTEGVVAADVPTAWLVAQIDQLIWTAWREISAGRLAPRDAPELALRTFLDGLGNKGESRG